MDGDKLVLAASKAREVDETTAPQLVNVVRELSLAAGIPMPRVYIIDDTAPNAFATGRDPKHASVAVTTGLLDKLDREELQGVIGHELSHVRNYDIRFALLVGVLVGSIALLADMFLRFTFWGGARRRRRPRIERLRRRRSGDHLRRRDHPRDPRADLRAPRPAGREPAARVPGRCLARRAHAQPLGPRAGAGDDLGGPGAAGGRQPGDPAPVHRQPDQEALRPARWGSSRPIRRSLDRVNRLRALTGEPPLTTEEMLRIKGLE